MTRPLAAGALLAGTVAVSALVLLMATVALGADATAPPVSLAGGDLRSDGAGPGLAGSPLVVLGAVVLVGIVTAFMTALLVRLTRKD